jgi:asparagine synthase (glutamine-hydrolysing)
MAHLALLIDDDSDRRDQFVARMQTLFAALPGATLATARTHNLVCVWAHGPRAPVSVYQEGHSLGILIGYAIDDDDRWISARDLCTRWHERPVADGVFDGYHVGIAFDAARGLVAAVDPLGMFPLHHAAADGGRTLIVSTTPEAVCGHPAFSRQIDRRGLAGILLVHGPLGDRPLLTGVKRLRTGHRLRWTAGNERHARVEEVEAYRLVGTPPPRGETPEDTRRRIDHELAIAIRRHRPAAADTTLLLSGGLDSRLVAGVLADEGIPTRALVLGQHDDYEVLAGTAVARTLGMPLEVVSTESIDADFPQRMRNSVRFSHLNAAPGADDLAEGLALARFAGTFFWSGIAFDWVFEPIGINNGRDPKTGGWCFDRLLTFMNSWGVPRGHVPALLGADGPELCAAVIEELRMACMNGPAEPVVQSALIRWDQRVKNHVATALHRTTFHAWPLLPATDRRLFSAVIGLPVKAYADRRLENDVLRRRRPDLAALPLDRNSFAFHSLAAADTSRLGRLGRKLEQRLQKWYWQRVRGFEPRRYERLFNVDHPRWLALRREAEPLRKRLHGLLDARVLDNILPPPDVRTKFRNAVNQGSGLRLLLGLALWHDM